MSHSMIEFVFTCKYFHLKPPLIAQLCKLDYSMQQFTWVSTILHPPPRLFFCLRPPLFFAWVPQRGGLCPFFCTATRRALPIFLLCKKSEAAPAVRKKMPKAEGLGFASAHFFAWVRALPIFLLCKKKRSSPGKKNRKAERKALPRRSKKMSKQPWQ